MGIFVRVVIRTARESPIRFGTSTLSTMISPFLRFSRYNVSLDHVNPEQSNHTESAYHGDWKLCSTRCENFYRGDKTSFRGPKIFVSQSKIVIPDDDLLVS
ncbi:hypothetical protein Taro_023450 [Colocasia esculenta]|uniref:Uncharacterized protein n=1 Tax=Colocasia esculenta TaxID=4460 RepID=A0A843V482_COLES|nr:hypothetical protein [Colocasia esculenta]